MFCSDISYVHRLVDAHVKSGHFLEAGLTLKLHASLYSWTQSDFVDPFSYGSINFPRQSHFGRKESLSLQVLDYLGEHFLFPLACCVFPFLADSCLLNQDEEKHTSLLLLFVRNSKHNIALLLLISEASTHVRSTTMEGY